VGIERRSAEKTTQKPWEGGGARGPGPTQEFMVLEYAGSARLLVPVTNLDLVQKYVGGSESPPPLSTLGGEAWNAAKLRAQAAVEKLARR
jgi:transcription-repair coupling factor (superfamily II helicase)